MLVWFTISLLILALIFSVYLVSQRIKRLLLPLVELLDQQSSESNHSYTFDNDGLHGHYDGRYAKFSIEVGRQDEARREFHIGLSCNAPWTFDVAKKSRLGRSPNPNRWKEKLSLGDKLSEARLEGSYSAAGAAYGQQLLSWVRKPEIQQRIEYLMLDRGVNYLALDGGTLEATYNQCRKKQFEITNVRAVLGAITVLARSLERESRGTLWERCRDAGRDAYQQGDYATAEKHFLAALKEAEDLGSENLYLAASLGDLAVVYTHQHRPEEAEPLSQRALAIYEKTLVPEDLNVARVISNLAVLSHGQGKLSEAEPLYQRALSIVSKALGSDHPEVSGCLNNLARLYKDQGRHTEADPLCRQALTVVEKALGPHHPDVATALENYALLLREMNRNDEADKMEARSKAIRNKYHPTYSKN